MNYIFIRYINIKNDFYVNFDNEIVLYEKAHTETNLRESCSECFFSNSELHSFTCSLFKHPDTEHTVMKHGFILWNVINFSCYGAEKREESSLMT